MLPATSAPEVAARLDELFGTAAASAARAAGDGGGGAAAATSGDPVRSALSLAAAEARFLENYLRGALGPPPQRPQPAFALFCEARRPVLAAAQREREGALRKELAAARGELLEAFTAGDGARAGGARRRVATAQAALEAPSNPLALLRAEWDAAGEGVRADFARREVEAGYEWGALAKAYEERLVQGLRLASLHGETLARAGRVAAAPLKAAGGGGSGGMELEGGAGAAREGEGGGEGGKAPVLSQEDLWAAALLRPRSRVVDRLAAQLGGWGAGAQEDAAAAAAAAAGADAGAPSSSAAAGAGATGRGGGRGSRGGGARVGRGGGRGASALGASPPPPPLQPPLLVAQAFTPETATAAIAMLLRGQPMPPDVDHRALYAYFAAQVGPSVSASDGRTLSLALRILHHLQQPPYSMPPPAGFSEGLRALAEIQQRAS